MGIASPYRAGAQFGSYPLRAGRSRGVVQGQKGQQEPFAAVFVVLPYPSPVTALLPLGGALGWFPAVAPMVQQGQPRT